jgi:hypothetical protein
MGVKSSKFRSFKISTITALREYMRNREYWKIKRPSFAMQFLYDADEFYRFRGGEALGYLCKGNTAKNFILRLFWHLSDESGAYCVGAPLGIAEIGRANPDVFDGFKNKFVSLIDDWEVEKKYVIYGMGRVAHIILDAYPDPRKKLTDVLENTTSPEVAAYAVLTAKKLNCCSDAYFRVVEKFNHKKVKIYNGEKIVDVSFPEVINLSYQF